MEVERGESSSRKRKWEGPPVVAATTHEQQAKEQSPLTLATLKAVKEQVEKRGNRISHGVIVKYFDNSDAPYDWLLPGWVVEERYVPSGRKGLGRIYKYYCDPTGHMYYSKRVILFGWKKMNIICLDT
ncbi:hypothetical protein ES332_D06G219000v1 [Gossypium tomentosum]|uniref:MBD domain-containing protein n=1 Tax=Gossypium tomentosum TaxID=34277 RepID=A0A5D2KM12_GOSTO|nr:hypothetical protein ES332_D06G219000v1 [Gossypium tomentosum]TYH67874.1 hypothetical protein ES332_D06G219000v1 [Gossypium tomentosum]